MVSQEEREIQLEQMRLTVQMNGQAEKVRAINRALAQLGAAIESLSEYCGTLEESILDYTDEPACVAVVN